MESIDLVDRHALLKINDNQLIEYRESVVNCQLNQEKLHKCYQSAIDTWSHLYQVTINQCKQIEQIIGDIKQKQENCWNGLNDKILVAIKEINEKYQDKLNSLQTLNEYQTNIIPFMNNHNNDNVNSEGQPQQQQQCNELLQEYDNQLDIMLGNNNKEK